MSNDQSIIQIHAFLSSQMTAEERAHFQSWLSESEANQALFEEVKQGWELAADYRTPDFDIASARSAMPFLNEDSKDESVTAHGNISHPRRLWWGTWSAAASVILLIVAGFWFWNKTNTSTLIASGSDAELVELEDGSVIYLKSDGVVAYPEHFTTKTRRVELDGEAYFDIAREESRMFIVETDHALITVLGTEFVVDEREDGVVEVHVTEGKVRIDPFDSDVHLEITEGQSAYFDSNSGELKRVKSSDPNEIAWHTRRLAFKVARLAEVLKVLEDVYDVTISFENEELAECTLTANYPERSLETILTDFSQIWGCKVIQTDSKTYALRGGTCD